MPLHRQRKKNIFEQYIDNLPEINEILNKTIDNLTCVCEKQEKILLTGNL